MTHSSQAGLASFQPQAVNIPVTQPHLTVRTDSGVAFELRNSPKFSNLNFWTVIGSIGRQSTTAEAIVGMTFSVGENPMLFARGYAQIVQRELNNHFDQLITEVPR